MPRALRSNTNLTVDTGRSEIKKVAKKNLIDKDKYEKKIKKLQAKLRTSNKTIRQLERKQWDTRVEKARLDAVTRVLEEERTEYMTAYKELEIEKKQLGKKKPETAPLICQICLLAFSADTLGTPRMFKCGHSVCLLCAQEIEYEHAYNHGPRGVIRCPFCRQETPVENGAESLIKNFAIYDSLTPVPSNKKEEGAIVQLPVELPAPAPVPAPVPAPAPAPEAPAPPPPARSLFSRISSSLFGRFSS